MVQRADPWLVGCVAALGVIGGVYFALLFPGMSDGLFVGVLAVTTGGCSALLGRYVAPRIRDPFGFAAAGLVAGGVNGFLAALLFSAGDLLFADRDHLSSTAGVVSMAVLFGVAAAIPFTPWLMWLRIASQQRGGVRPRGMLADAKRRAMLVPVALAGATGACFLWHLDVFSYALVDGIGLASIASLVVVAALDVRDWRRTLRVAAHFRAGVPAESETPADRTLDLGTGDAELDLLASGRGPYRDAPRAALRVLGDPAAARRSLGRHLAVDACVVAVVVMAVAALVWPGVSMTRLALR